MEKKKILLLGDSIRMGYDEYVRQSMANIADVYFPRENCCYTANYLRNLHNWTDALGLYEADAVHFNVGHWDTVRIYGDGPLTKPDNYRDNLERIVDRIRYLFPEAKIIFATSTPVVEEGFIEEFETRHNSDVELYNEIAVGALTKKGVIINDLHALMKGKPDSLHSDQTHYYTPDATELLGKQVCKVLCETLSLDASALNYPDKALFARPEVKSDREMFEKKGRVYVLKR